MENQIAEFKRQLRNYDRRQNYLKKKCLKSGLDYQQVLVAQTRKLFEDVEVEWSNQLQAVKQYFENLGENV